MGNRNRFSTWRLNFGIQIEHACGGSCACTTCHVHMKTGAEVNLSPMEEDELDRVETAGDLTLESRLGCQAVVKGDVVVEMPAWNRNYVSEGGGSMNLGDAIPPPAARSNYCFSSSIDQCPGQFFGLGDLHAHPLAFLRHLNSVEHAR